MRIKGLIKTAGAKLYPRCPVLVQNLLVSIYGLLIYVQRYGKTYRRYLKLYSARDYSSCKKNRDYQDREFLRLLHYAVRHSAFYKEFYKEVKLTDIKTVKDITKLPVLTKEIFKANLNRIYTIPAGKGIELHTGGTTGVPISIRIRRGDLQKRMAYLDAFKLEYGFRSNKMRCARFSARNIIAEKTSDHVFWRDNYISRQRFYSIHHLTRENMDYYIDNLNDYRPEAIEGLVSAIYQLARYILDNGIVMKYTPKAVFTTSETVLPLHREIIEMVFRCPLRDQYASNDGAPFIKQCRFGSYHENLDTGVFEHIETLQGVKLLVTSFFSYATPLIRYDIEDYIRRADRRDCPCGACHPVIAGIEGRSNDFLTTKTRGNIGQVTLSLLVSELPGAFEQLQLIQVSSNLIRVKVVMKEGTRMEEYQSLLQDKLGSYLGQGIEFAVERVDYIERENSGKYRLVINRMSGL